MTSTEYPDYLFVYGTLMQRYVGNTYTETLKQYADYQSLAFANGKMYLVDYYPGFVPTDSFEFVYGELFRLKNATELFTALDPYEDYDPTLPQESLFRREITDVYTDIHQPPVRAWVYVYNQPTNGLLRIESGDFLEFTKA